MKYKVGEYEVSQVNWGNDSKFVSQMITKDKKMMFHAPYSTKPIKNQKDAEEFVESFEKLMKVLEEKGY